MDSEKISITSVKARLTGQQYIKILNMLPLSTKKSSFVIGSCGSTSQLNEIGIDLVLVLHNINDALIDNENSSVETAVSWIQQEQKYYPLLPFVIRPANHDTSDRTSLILKRLLHASSGQCLSLQIADEGKLEGVMYLHGEVHEVSSILVAGSDILIWPQDSIPDSKTSELSLRFEQSFGSKTHRLVSNLKLGVVGVSGTGSPIAEMLYRLGAGEVLLIDDDCVEEKNLGRIYNSSVHDAKEGRPKVEVISDAFKRYGLPTKVTGIRTKANEPETIRRLAQCDIVFGCMDTHSGRNLLNRICTFYSIPYFDLGVNLEADKQGSVKTVCGAVHYLQPDGSSLLSRKAINVDTIAAEDLMRTDPVQYEQLQKEKYIKGVNEEKPAVITVNTLIASLAMNDFLARLHPYRNNPNAEIGSITVDLLEPRIVLAEEGKPDLGLARYLGLGDIQPLLGIPT